MNNYMDIDSAVDVKGLLCAPLCKFGTDNCNIRIVKDTHGPSHMFVSVKQTIGGQEGIYIHTICGPL